MNKKQETLWILDTDPVSQKEYHSFLELRYNLTHYNTLNDFKKAHQKIGKETAPKILICDLKFDNNSFLDLLLGPEKDKYLNIPFILISEVEDIDFMRLCFIHGALDYFVKPIKQNEIIIKLEKYIRTYQVEQLSKISGPLEIKINDITLNNLTFKEYKILKLFTYNRAYVVTKQEILQNVWKETVVAEKTVDVHLHNIRKKIAPFGLKIYNLDNGVWKLGTQPTH